MNNCESDKVKLWKLIRSSNDEILSLYTDIENTLSEYLALLESCCEDKNDLLQQIIQQLDVLIQNLIDCCEAVKDRLDDIIDIIIDPIPDIYNRWQVQYNDHICFTDDEDNYIQDWLVQFDDHGCEAVPDSDFPFRYSVDYSDHICSIIEPPVPDDIVWAIEYEGHLCEARLPFPQEIEYQAAFEDHLCIVREPLPSEIEWYVEFEDHVCWTLDEFDEYWPIAYFVEFDNRACIQGWECDLEGQLIAVTEDDVTISYEGIWIDYTCVLREGQDNEGGLNLDGDGYIEFRDDTVTSSTTTENITTTTTTIEIPPFINSGTRIYIYFDSSGSMNQTLQPLLDMRNGNLKAALLPYYNNDETLYNEMVQVVSNSTERTLHMLNWLAADMPDGNVISLVFQDEASPTYHTTAIEPRTAQFNADLSALRTRLGLFTDTEYRGVVFQVATPSGNNVELFQPFLLAVKDGTGEYAGTNGLSDIPNINVVCNVASGITYASNPAYYLNLILGALNENIEFCTLDLNSDPFVFNVSVAAYQSITLPFTSIGYYNATVDYGDGSGVLPITAYNDANATHIYASAGNYDISIRGYTHGFSVNNNTSFRSIVNEVKSWGDLRIRKLDFYGCNNLTALPNEPLPPTLSDLIGFVRGTAISSIYALIFKKCVGVSVYSGAFSETLVTSIPPGLFNNSSLATNFSQIFYSCLELEHIPSGLLRNTINGTNYSSAFQLCRKAQLHRNIFFLDGEENIRFLNKSVSFQSCFNRTSFTGIQGEAPELWNVDFGTGTPVKTSCFAGLGNSQSSLSNYCDIPEEWGSDLSSCPTTTTTTAI